MNFFHSTFEIYYAILFPLFANFLLLLNAHIFGILSFWEDINNVHKLLFLLHFKKWIHSALDYLNKMHIITIIYSTCHCTNDRL